MGIHFNMDEIESRKHLQLEVHTSCNLLSVNLLPSLLIVTATSDMMVPIVHAHFSTPMIS